MARFIDDKIKMEYRPSDEDFDKALEYFKLFLRNQIKINTSHDLLDGMMYYHIMHIDGIGECDTIVRFCLRNDWWKGGALERLGIHVVARNNPDADAMLNIEIDPQKLGNNRQQIYLHEGIFLCDGWIKE